MTWTTFVTVFSSLIDRRGFLPADESVQTASVDIELPTGATKSEINVVGGSSQMAFGLQGSPSPVPVSPNSHHNSSLAWQKCKLKCKVCVCEVCVSTSRYTEERILQQCLNIFVLCWVTVVCCILTVIFVCLQNYHIFFLLTHHISPSCLHYYYSMIFFLYNLSILCFPYFLFVMIWNVKIK